MRSLVALLLILLLCGSVFAIATSAETNIFSITEQTLPVVLSSFSASITVNGFVSLRWVTESETELLGYRVYRSEQNNLSSAITITTPYIPATNSTITHTYTFSDREVETEHTYFYWLEIVEFSHSSYHGPISISIQGSNVPPLPEQTLMGSIYPNPFRQGAQAQFDVEVKDSDRARVDIYNLIGQRVKSYQLQPGSHQLY